MGPPHNLSYPENIDLYFNLPSSSGFCCVVYTPCPAETNPFTLSNGGMADGTAAMTAAICAEDFVTIEGTCALNFLIAVANVPGSLSLAL